MMTAKTLKAMQQGDVLADHQVKGLRARRQTDNVVFELRYRVNGKRRSIAIGPFGTGTITAVTEPNGQPVTFGDPRQFTLARARGRAMELLGQIAGGHDPQLEAGPDGLTLKQALELHAKRLRNKGGSGRTIENYERDLRLHLGDWLNTPLRQISRPMVRQRHGKISQTGNYAANSVMRAFRAIWNTALMEDEHLQPDPTRAVHWNKTHRRDTAILPEELADWWAKVRTIKNPVRRDYYVFCLLTGLRRRSAAEVAWEDVDFLRKTLRIPRPKGGKPFVLPLSDYLVELLQRRKRENPKLSAGKQSQGKPWVFPAHSRSGHIEEPKGTVVIERGGKKRKVKDPSQPSPHALRHTFIALCENRVRIPLLHTKLLVNHAVPKDITLGYAGASDIESLRQSMQDVTAYILECVKPAGGKVVTFPEGKQDKRSA